MSIFRKNNENDDFNFIDQLVSLLNPLKFKGNEGHNKMHLKGCMCGSCLKIWESQVKGVKR